MADKYKDPVIIGRGGFGVVTRRKKIDNGKLYAIKELNIKSNDELIMIKREFKNLLRV